MRESTKCSNEPFRISYEVCELTELLPKLKKMHSCRKRWWRSGMSSRGRTWRSRRRVWSRCVMSVAYSTRLRKRLIRITAVDDVVSVAATIRLCIPCRRSHERSEVSLETHVSMRTARQTSPVLTHKRRAGISGSTHGILWRYRGGRPHGKWHQEGEVSTPQQPFLPV